MKTPTMYALFKRVFLEHRLGNLDVELNYRTSRFFGEIIGTIDILPMLNKEMANSDVLPVELLFLYALHEIDLDNWIAQGWIPDPADFSKKLDSVKDFYGTEEADPFSSEYWSNAFARVVGMSFLEFNQYLHEHAEDLPEYLQDFDGFSGRFSDDGISFEDLFALHLVYHSSLKNRLDWGKVFSE
ncbi:MAG: hypothetical protein LAT55_13060 [Opitutales bacterium]|nr:hypothetical protein [Opitutales bacterium]